MPRPAALKAPLRRLAPLVGLLALLALGCEDSVVPAGDAGRPFTLYAVLDPTEDRQALRLAAFRPGLDASADAEADAEVTSTDLNTGELVAWTDSLVAFGEGRFGHVFHADFRPVYGHTYRVEARRSDGAVSSAEVTVPPLVEPLPLEAVRSGTVVLPTLWPGVPELNEPQVTYVVEAPDCEVRAVTLPASRPAEPFEFGWRVETDLLADAEAVFEALAPATSLGLIAVRVGAHVASANWYPPGGTFDPEVLVDPNAFTNVRNGFGFVGAGYVLSVPVRIEPTYRSQAGFRAPSPGC